MNQIKISFLGDISLNDDYIRLNHLNLNPFIHINKSLSQSDLVIGNLESFIVGNMGENLAKRPRLTTTIETLNLLKSLHLDVATLANNHVYDHLEDGFQKTKTCLTHLNIASIGAGSSKQEARMPFISEINNIKVCVLNYVDKNTNPNIPDNSQLHVNYFDLDNAIEDLCFYRKNADILIVMLHWGGLSDYSSYPYFDQPQIAKTLIDNGCDLIIGGHSHTLQPYEVYKGKLIFYSLGNFCFSDICFEDKIICLDGRKAKETIIPQITFFENKSYRLDLIGLKNKALTLEKSTSVITKLKFRNLKFKLFQKFKFLWHLNFFLFKKFHKYYSYLFNNGVTNKKNIFKQLYKLAK